MTTAHVVPVMSSDDRPHELGHGDCWCLPQIHDAPGDDRIVIHRRTQGSGDDGEWFVARVGDEVLS